MDLFNCIFNYYFSFIYKVYIVGLEFVLFVFVGYKVLCFVLGSLLDEGNKDFSIYLFKVLGISKKDFEMIVMCYEDW